VAQESWPPQDQDLVFLFQDAFEEPFALDEALDEPVLNYALKASGEARFDGAGCLVLSYGRFEAPNQGPVLARAFGEGEGFGLEFWLEPEGEQQAGILNLEGAFQLAQDQRKLIFTAKAAAGPVRLVATLPDLKAHHVLIGWAGGHLRCFLDGAVVAETDMAQPFGSGSFGAFTIGSGTHQQSGWQGRLADLALFNGSVDGARAQQHARAHEALGLDREPPKPLVLKGKLVAKSKVAKPRDIAPYAASLAIYEYEVLQVMSGFTWDKRVRVAHWVVLGHQALPAAGAEIGAVHQLELEPMNANRQLANTHRTETLPVDAKIQVFLATRVLRP
jgi:hypothetical protein